jgi:hypothetical protein
MFLMFYCFISDNFGGTTYIAVLLHEITQETAKRSLLHCPRPGGLDLSRHDLDRESRSRHDLGRESRSQQFQQGHLDWS